MQDLIDLNTKNLFC